MKRDRPSRLPADRSCYIKAKPFADHSLFISGLLLGSIGYLLTMTFAPPGWEWMLAGFVLFRFFDILKPWPVSLADRKVHGGFGIMLDDVLAGLMAAAGVGVLQQWF